MSKVITREYVMGQLQIRSMHKGYCFNETQEMLSDVNITIVPDFVSGCPGYCGAVVFVIYGNISFYEVFTHNRETNSLEITTSECPDMHEGWDE